MDARDDQALQNKGYDAFEARKSKVLEIMSARGNYPIPAPVAKQGLRAFESPVAAAFTFLSALDPEGPWTFVWQDFKGGWHVRAGEAGQLERGIFRQLCGRDLRERLL